MVEIENKTLLHSIISLIEETRESAIRSVDFHKVQLNWYIGKFIFEEEQNGKDRAEYGKYLIKYLSRNLEPSYGSSYSTRNLYFFIQFYKAFPIVNELRSQLNWSQYRLLLRIENQDKKEFYIAESIKNHWTSR
jgi:hypothetical protein